MPGGVEDQAFRCHLADNPRLVASAKRVLRGHDLACWCPLDALWCHADVWLEIANTDPEGYEADRDVAAAASRNRGERGDERDNEVLLVAPLSSSWPWVGCPDCGRAPGEPHKELCGVHDEPDDDPGPESDVEEVRYFSEAEALSLVGRRYRATAGYSGVEAGTVGAVSGVYALDRRRQQFGVDVTWEGLAGDSPLEAIRGGRTDGFSRRDLLLVFTGGPHRGRRAMEALDGPDDGPVAAGGAGVARDPR